VRAAGIDADDAVPWGEAIKYIITIKHPLLIHYLLSLKLSALALNSLDTLSEVRTKAFTPLLF
jgi:hypothetical protein